MQRSKDGGEGTAPGDEDGELTKAAEEHQRRRPPSSLYRVRAGTRRARREPGLVDNFSRVICTAIITILKISINIITIYLF